MLTKFYKLIWLMLMWFYLSFESINDVYLRLKSMLQWSYDLCRGGLITKLLLENENRFLEECKRNLSKIPKHLSIIVGPDNKHVNELLLSRIFVYASKVEVDCISYFDTRLPEKGYVNLKDIKHIENFELKFLKENYYQCVYSSHNLAKRKAPISSNGLSKLNGFNLNQINGCVKSNGYISRNNNENGKAASDSLCNRQEAAADNLPKSRLKIYQLQSESGRPLIAKFCRDLFKRSSSSLECLLKDRTVLSEEITKYLTSQLYESSDPDLCIIFHNNLCTFGMLPWQTSFTEFYTHSGSGANDFTAFAFAKILYKFSRCEQRWGK